MYWLPYDVSRCLSSASCVAIVLLACRFPIRFLIRLALRLVARVVPLLALSRRLVPSCLFVWLACPSRYARSPRSAYSPRLSCRRAGRSSSRSHFVMRPASRLCVLACRPVFRSPSGNGCGCHRLVPAFRCCRAAPFSYRSLVPPFVSGNGEMSGDLVDGGGIFFLWDFCAIGGLSYRVCAIMDAVAMGTSE